jgi:cold shock CspA family protein
MTVAELIEKLKTMPQDLPVHIVHINDEGGGTLHEDIDGVFDIAADPEWGDEAVVVIAVNSL